MVEIPETRYARNGPVSIAYQTVGDGPIEVLFVESGMSHLDLRWEHPPFAKFHDRFAGFCRLISYDKRGCGLSDRTVELPTIEQEASDVLVVLDAVGVERAHLFGDADGGAVALTLAATQPDRVDRVAVYGAFARSMEDEGYPGGIGEGQVALFEESIASDGLGPSIVGLWESPGTPLDPATARWFNRTLRAALSPVGQAVWFRHWCEIDIRPTNPKG